MRHRSPRPPLLARCSSAWAVGGPVLRRALHGPPRGLLPARPGRMVLGAVVTLSVVALVLAVPVISGADGGSPGVQLDSSSTSASSSGSPPVVMGVDGRPAAPEDPAGTMPGAGAATSAVPSATATTGAPDRAAPPPAGAARSSAAPSTTAPTTAPSTAAPSTAGRTGPTTEQAPEGPPPDGPSAGPLPSGVAASSPPAGVPSPAATSPSAATTPSTGSPTRSPGAEPPAGVAAAPGTTAALLAALNAARTDAGCGPLAGDADLASAAQAHSAAMSATGALTFDGLDVPARGAAAVAHGLPDPATVVARWLADPTDRAALLHCDRTAAGVGAVDGWWTTVLR